MARSFAVSILIVTVSTVVSSSLHPLSDEFISLINSKQSSWKAGRNFPLDTSLTHIKGLMGLLEAPSPVLPVEIHDKDLIASLPETFDPRDKWPNCPTLNDIRDQGSCGSCWAFGAVETMTDRVCTYSNGTKNFYFSAQDMTSCGIGWGCKGGIIPLAFIYWRDYGIVSGGAYNSSKGCRPYEIPPCEHAGVKGNRPQCNGNSVTPDCVEKCEASYKVDYNKDRHRAKRIFNVKEEDGIKAELYKNGPVEAGFSVYADFIHYKSGVYSHTSGDRLGGHAIKILGWGVENGKKYWLCANSWNSDWGDKGFFKILRGENDCGIEGQVVAGEPDLHGF